MTNAAIQAVNGLTARWASQVSASTVVSAAGARPLLGFLADGAGGEGRAELAAVLGVPVRQAAYGARESTAALEEVDGAVRPVHGRRRKCAGAHFPGIGAAPLALRAGRQAAGGDGGVQRGGAPGGRRDGQGGDGAGRARSSRNRRTRRP
ncbi:hypothetical protein [Streptomyces bullii]|uniref:Uncharacterized protein n=1 Tax=Streptomyces bullii TaxID=349910 RepID=A0ABW0UQW4_9ACTN